MMNFLSTHNKSILVCIVASTVSSHALAYIGPGSGLSAIGSFLALILAIFVALFGFFWFPLKRMLSKKQRDTDTKQIDEENLEAELGKDADQ